jgi:hypothetical protein
LTQAATIDKCHPERNRLTALKAYISLRQLEQAVNYEADLNA